MLILQIVIKQWDKSQRTEAHENLRAKSSDKYPLSFPPAIYVCDRQCIIDQHGDDIQGTRVKHPKNVNKNILFDRFEIDLDNKIMTYLGAKPAEIRQVIGSVDNQWIQCKYNCRYSIFEADQYYWLYEEVTLNAVCLKPVNENVFLNTEPAIIYEDFNVLDTMKKP